MPRTGHAVQWLEEAQTVAVLPPAVLVCEHERRQRVQQALGVAGRVVLQTLRARKLENGCTTDRATRKSRDKGRIHGMIINATKRI